MAGYTSTAHVAVTAADDGYGEVRVYLRATHYDGTVREFSGSCTVEDGEIVGADIREVT